MENKPFKTIVLKKEVVSNLNDNQMNVMWGGRAISYESLDNDFCNSVNLCCTVFADCNSKNGCNTYTCVTICYGQPDCNVPTRIPACNL